MIDQTGLQGRYDIDVTYTPEPFLQQRWPNVEVRRPPESIPTVLHCLPPSKINSGLKLQPKKMPIASGGDRPCRTTHGRLSSHDFK